MWWLMIAVSWATCPEPEPLLQTLEDAVVEGRLKEAKTASDQLVEAFACGKAAEPQMVARMWLAEAVILTANGEREAATDALRSAARVDPEVWVASYGAKLRKQYASAASRPDGRAGSLEVVPLPRGYVVAVDGRVSKTPVSVLPGPHLVQVGPRPRRMAFAQVATVSSGLGLELDPGLTATPFEVLPRDTPSFVRGAGVGVGVAGLALLAGSIPAHFAARSADPAANQAAHDARVTTNHVLFWSGALWCRGGGRPDRGVVLALYRARPVSGLDVPAVDGGLVATHGDRGPMGLTVEHQLHAVLA